MSAGTTPLILGSVTFETTLDLSSENSTLNISGMFSNDISSIRVIELGFVTAGRQGSTSPWVSFSAEYFPSNAATGNGAFSFTHEVDGSLPRGVYALDGALVLDRAGNIQYFTAAQLLAAGSLVQLVLNDGSDIPVSMPTDGNDLLISYAESNYLKGFGGDDTLQGGTGYNRLEGGDGDDLLIAMTADDYIDGGSGIDTITWANFSSGMNLELDTPSNEWWKARNIEKFILSSFNDTLIIGQPATVWAGAGHDVVDGWKSWPGKVGPLTLYGEGGNDTLTGGDGSDFIYGGSDADYIRGFDGNDILDGGSGADIMAGGAGDDIYWVDNKNDQVLEGAGGGKDTVYASVSYVLTSPPMYSIEKLIAVGTSSISLTGDNDSNRIIGNAGANTLKGGLGNDTLDGGVGVDKLYGGIGNDIYYVDNARDVVVESPYSGNDSVYASTSYSLAANYEIERIYARSGTAAIALTGNSASNVIYGNSGANKLNGGLGLDVLAGGAGKDGFLFTTRIGSSNVDKVVDFKSADDAFYLDNAVFTKLGKGSAAGIRISSDMFVENTRAKDREDRIIYDRSKGALYYDADGTGSQAQVKFATISNKAKLYYHDFFVI